MGAACGPLVTEVKLAALRACVPVLQSHAGIDFDGLSRVSCFLLN